VPDDYRYSVVLYSLLITVRRLYGEPCFNISVLRPRRGPRAGRRRADGGERALEPG
jgi:hypothetical protein